MKRKQSMSIKYFSKTKKIFHQTNKEIYQFEIITMSARAQSILALGSVAVAGATATALIYSKENEDFHHDHHESQGSNLEGEMKNLTDLTNHVVDEAKELAEMTKKVQEKVVKHNSNFSEEMKHLVELSNHVVDEAKECAEMAKKVQEKVPLAEKALKESVADAKVVKDKDFLAA